MSSLTKEGYTEGGFIDLHNQNVEYTGRKLAIHAWDSGEELNETTMSSFPEYASMKETGRYYVQQVLIRSKLFAIEKNKTKFTAKAIQIEDGTELAKKTMKKIDSFRKYISDNVFHELTYGVAQKYAPGEIRPKSIEDLHDMIAISGD